jgi:ADP-heptose:LPS heptosyltransferase
MPFGAYRPELLRTRANRRFYRCLFGLYRAAFPTSAPPTALSADSLRRVLVVQHHGVGDMILTTPLLAFLKEQAPQAEIDVLASTRNAVIVAGDRYVARLHVYDGTWHRWLRLIPRLRARRYDAIFSGQAGNGLHEGLVASAAARRNTAKISIWRPKRYRGLFTALPRTPRGVDQTADRLLYVAHRALGGQMPRPSVVEYPLRMPQDPAADARVAELLAASGVDRYALVNVSAHFAVRDWSPERCAAFARLLLERHPDLSVVLTRAPGKERQAEEVATRLASTRVLHAPAMPLLAIAALVRRAAVVVSPDTSLVHIASACRRPVIVLYAPKFPTEVAPWLPLGVPYRVFVSRLRGSMADIAPERVADALDELLELSVR